MKHLTSMGLGLISALTLAGGLHAQSIGIGAGTQGSQNYAVNAGVAKFLTDTAGMDVRVQAYGGSGQSMPLIDSGRLDIQMLPSPDFESGVNGNGQFEGRPLKNLRVLASLSSSAYGFMVRVDAPYNNVSEVAGLKITHGFSAQPTLVPQVDAILAASGLTMEEMVPVNVPAVPNGVDEFISGAADIAFFSLQGGKAREADAAVGIKWLAIPNTPEAEAAMKAIVPTSYIKVVEPSPANVAITEPTALMGYDYVLTAGAHVTDEVVAKLLAALHDNPEGVREIRATFAEFAPENMAPPMDGLIYHDGAVKYYKSVGLME